VRGSSVAINPAGGRASEPADRALEGAEAEVLGALTADERVTLRGLLSRALEGEGRPAEPAWVGSDG
jgi:hypothetical protein